MKKKMISALLCAAMVSTMLAGCGGSGGGSDDGGKTDDGGSKGGDKLVYWSMWEATEPQGQAIQAAIDAYTEESGVEVDVQFLMQGQRLTCLMRISTVSMIHGESI